MSDHVNVTNINNVEWAEHSHGERFGYRRKSLGRVTGSEKLGCSLYEVPPGRRAWPYHYHAANEEAIYVLKGSGMLRIGEKEIRISEDDYATLPASPEVAHQVVNDSDDELRYLCFSTMIEPDLMVYPDSNKIGIFAGAAPGGSKEKRTFGKFLKTDAEVDYYEGE